MKNKKTWSFTGQSDIAIDLSGCRFADEIHAKLKEAFGFPKHYGENWSAFWDCLDDFCGDRTSQTVIRVTGLNDLSKDLRGYVDKMIEIMNRAEKGYPDVHFLFEDE